MTDETRRVHLHLDLDDVEPGEEIHLHLHLGAAADGASAQVTAEPSVEAMLKRLMDYDNAANVRAAYEGLSGLGLTPHVPKTRKAGSKVQAYLRWTHGESDVTVVYLNAASATFARKGDLDKVATLPGAIKAREVRFPIHTPKGVQQALAAVKLVIS